MWRFIYCRIIPRARYFYATSRRGQNVNERPPYWRRLRRLRLGGGSSDLIGLHCDQHIMQSFYTSVGLQARELELLLSISPSRQLALSSLFHCTSQPTCLRPAPLCSSFCFFRFSQIFSSTCMDPSPSVILRFSSLCFCQELVKLDGND